MTVSCYNFYSKQQSHSHSREHEMCNTTEFLHFFPLISDHTLSLVIGASIGVVVLLVVVGVVIWWVLKRGNFRKENTKGDYSI